MTGLEPALYTTGLEPVIIKSDALSIRPRAALPLSYMAGESSGFPWLRSSDEIASRSGRKNLIISWSLLLLPLQMEELKCLNYLTHKSPLLSA